MKARDDSRAGRETVPAMIRKTLYLLIFLLIGLAAGCVHFLLLGYTMIPEHFGIDIAFLLMAAAMFLWVPWPEIQFWAGLVFLSVVAAIACVNVNLQEITGEIFTWDKIALAGIVSETLEGTHLLDYTPLFAYVPLLSLYIVLHALIRLRFPGLRKPSRFTWKKLILSFGASVLVFSGGWYLQHAAYVGTLEDVSEEAGEDEIYLSDAFLYETLDRDSVSLEKFGTYGYYVKSLNFYLGITSDAETSQSLLDEYFAQTAEADTSNAYTGISEGNNVIMILLESFEWFAVDPVLTPTLYRLFVTEGIPFDAYYSKQKTDMAEASALFGSLPSTGSLFWNYWQNDCPFALPSMYKTAFPDSRVWSFHNNVGTFYNRENAHPGIFGFDGHVQLSDMNLPDNGGEWVQSDAAMFESQVETMIPDEGGFFTYITTFTMHGGYEYRDSLASTYAWFDEQGILPRLSTLDLYMRTYMAAAMDLDAGLSRMMDRLEATGQLENTTILLFADHNAYYYDFTFRVRGLDPDDETDVEAYHLPAAIYDLKLKAAMEENGETSIEKFATTVDFAPTLLNLLGLEYNPSWYVGADVFSAEPTLSISPVGGIFNDRFYTSDVSAPLYSAPDSTEEEWEEFQTLAASTLRRTNYADLVYSINYFRSVDEG